MLLNFLQRTKTIEPFGFSICAGFRSLLFILPMRCSWKHNSSSYWCVCTHTSVISVFSCKLLMELREEDKRSISGCGEDRWRKRAEGLFILFVLLDSLRVCQHPKQHDVVWCYFYEALTNLKWIKVNQELLQQVSSLVTPFYIVQEQGAITSSLFTKVTFVTLLCCFNLSWQSNSVNCMHIMHIFTHTVTIVFMVRTHLLILEGLDGVEVSALQASHILTHQTGKIVFVCTFLRYYHAATGNSLSNRLKANITEHYCMKISHNWKLSLLKGHKLFKTICPRTYIYVLIVCVKKCN